MLRILVVEDNAELRDTLALLLEDADRFVAACASAEEALQEFARAPFDLVFTDVNLPKLSGYELAARVLELWPQTWIVYSSGAPPARPTGPARRVRFLAKPFTMEALDALLAEIEHAGPPGG